MITFWSSLICLVLSSAIAHAFDDPAEQDRKSAMRHAVSSGSEQRAEDQDRRIGRVHEKTRIQREKEIKDSADADPAYKDYLRFKNGLAHYGITAQIAPTLLNQWGVPNGGKAAFQGIVSPSVNWDAFDLRELGQGSVQFSYSFNRYGNQQSGASLTGRIKAITPINDTPTNDYTFNQLTYTHVFPGKLFQISVGQYPFSNFDYNQYAANQQTNFVNYALSQNGSQAYVPDSLGAYIQINPTQTISLAAGFQDANNISGNRIQFSTASNGQYAWFGYAQWKPVIDGLGSAQYSLLFYQQPKVPAQMEASQGWSLNLVQNLDQRWGVFVRANAASGSIAPIASSLAGGLILNHPFGGIRGDQWGLGVAWNQTNKSFFPNQIVRDGEWIAETYLNLAASKVLQLGPSVQIIFNPALHMNTNAAAVFTLRATGLF